MDYHVVIEGAVDRFSREFDLYYKLSRRVHEICSNLMDENAIRAQVHFRVKSIKSLKGKLERFSKVDSKKYIFESIDNVFRNIGDLAAIRIASYRSEDIEIIKNLIKENFSGSGLVKELKFDDKDKYLDGNNNFYKASHCQLTLKDDDLIAPYQNLRGVSCELQVCSMMGHVWNEIEHDIGYKPNEIESGEDEIILLNALGNLTRTGDDIISMLIRRHSKTLEEKGGDFIDLYDFVAKVRGQIGSVLVQTNSGQVYEELKFFGWNNIESLVKNLDLNKNPVSRAHILIDAYNDYANEFNFEIMDKHSLDVILVLLFEKKIDDVINNHPKGYAQGRPPRIRVLADHYKKFKSVQSPKNIDTSP
jgi:ppGpp synthetase/RelA/SpoT-type nucleotidyltranferase